MSAPSNLYQNWYEVLFVIVQVTCTTPVMKALCPKICCDVVWNGIKLVPLPGYVAVLATREKHGATDERREFKSVSSNIDAHARQTRYYKTQEHILQSLY